jgi:hypothetical protein
MMNNIFLLLLCVLVAVFSQPQPLNISQWAGKKALFIFAHPDDITQKMKMKKNEKNERKKFELK